MRLNRRSYLAIAIVLCLILQLSLSLCSSDTNNAKIINPENLVLVCGDSKVLIVDFSNQKDTMPSIIWSWDANNATDLAPEYRMKKFNSIDDCKAIKDGKEILVSSSSGAIAILNKKDKKVLFYTEVPNAHSIELLPDDKIVAAASTAEKGNRLMVFDINSPEKLLFSDSLYSAHGVEWDDKRNSLFALGYDVLREYKIKENFKLELFEEWKIPGISGHDLQMTPDGNNLFITEHTGAWIFNIENEKFNKIDNFPDAENIKSISQNNSGQFVFTVPEESWWTYHVSFHNPTANLSFPDIHVYKARWFKN
jgi:hypothetical protein